MKRSVWSRTYGVLGAYWVGLLGALIAFIRLAEDVWEREPFRYDDALLTWFAAQQQPALTALAQGLSLLGSLVVFAVLTTLVYLWFRRVATLDAYFFVVSVLGALSLNGVAKVLFARLRPELFTPLEAAIGYAFPSGHAMLSAAFALAFFLVIRRQYRRWQAIVAAAALLFTLGISLSRLYLQVHYPSDVIAGWALSTAWVLGLDLWFRRRRSQRMRKSPPAS